MTPFPPFERAVAPEVQMGAPAGAEPGCAGLPLCWHRQDWLRAGHVNRLQPGASCLNLTLAAFHGWDQGCAMTQEQSLEQGPGCGWEWVWGKSEDSCGKWLRCRDRPECMRGSSLDWERFDVLRNGTAWTQVASGGAELTFEGVKRWQGSLALTELGHCSCGSPSGTVTPLLPNSSGLAVWNVLVLHWQPPGTVKRQEKQTAVLHCSGYLGDQYVSNFRRKLLAVFEKQVL